MSYQVLARKWRPGKFAEVVGQQHVVQALSNAIASGRLHHAYLFTGTRGVGKTTLGRILSKSLNCESSPGVEPCGECPTCIEIDQGRFVDLIEIDAASRTKVEDTREILDNVQYLPTQGRYKVYLIDEVHMLSRHSFNALLKTLEEPPPHVKFLLATTDPQKLPITILSRCLQFNLKALTQEQIAAQLNKILSQESVPFDEAAIGHIARAAKGSMRDGLSLTDQAIAHGAGELKTEQVINMLGLVNRDYLDQLCEGLLGSSATLLMEAIAKVAQFSPDYDRLLVSLQTLIHQAILFTHAPASINPLEPELPMIQRLSRSWRPEQLQLAYQILINGRRDLPYMPDGRAALEMILLRVMLFQPFDLQQGELRLTAVDEELAESNPPQTVALQSETLAAEQDMILKMAEDQGYQGFSATVPAAAEAEADDRSEPAAQSSTELEPISESTAPDSSSTPAEPAQAEIGVPAESKQPVEAEPQVSSAESEIPEIEDTSSELPTSSAATPAKHADNGAPQQAATQPSATDEGIKPQGDAAFSENDAVSALASLQSIIKTKNRLRSRLIELEQTEEGSDSPKKFDSDEKVETANQASGGEKTARTDADSIAVDNQPAPTKPAPQAEQHNTSIAAAADAELLSLQELSAYAGDGDDYLGDFDDYLPPEAEVQPTQVSVAQPQQKSQPQRQPVAPIATNHVVAPASQPQAEPQQKASPVVAAEPVTIATNSEVSYWETVIDMLGLDEPTRQLALDATLVKEGEGYHLRLPVMAKKLARSKAIQGILDSLHKLLGVNTAIQHSFVEQQQDETPRKALERRYQERVAQAKLDIQADPIVQKMLAEFDATVDLDTIRPV